MSTRLPAPAFESKICTMEELAERAAALPHPVVFTNGVFDILHRGHVTYLAQARSLGASLVVAVNSDASVRMLGKGDDRPINAEADRAAVLAALEAVDLVVVFPDKVPLEAVRRARPDIYGAAPKGPRDQLIRKPRLRAKWTVASKNPCLLPQSKRVPSKRCAQQGVSASDAEMPSVS